MCCCCCSKDQKIGCPESLVDSIYSLVFVFEWMHERPKSQETEQGTVYWEEKKYEHDKIDVQSEMCVYVFFFVSSLQCSLKQWWDCKLQPVTIVIAHKERATLDVYAWIDFFALLCYCIRAIRLMIYCMDSLLWKPLFFCNIHINSVSKCSMSNISHAFIKTCIQFLFFSFFGKWLIKKNGFYTVRRVSVSWIIK